MIEKAQPEQHEQLTHIAQAAKRHWGYPEHWIEAWKEVLIITPAFITDNAVYVERNGDEIAGFYALMGSGSQIILEHMWVLPSYMGTGVGKRLFTHAVEHAASLGATSIHIESDPNAEGFYHRMGARRVGEVRSELDGQPRVLPLLVVDVPAKAG
jgi:GNAT superfamily N-acetyltransferase